MDFDTDLGGALIIWIRSAKKHFLGNEADINQRYV
jgi:hypothetical protein